MFDTCVIRGRRFSPARFCAPLAGYTHSAFRRLLAELGGCGAMWTEMLAGRQVLSENFQSSPWLRRPPGETCLVFQLMVGSDDPLDRILPHLAGQGVEAVDLNLACDSRMVRSCEAGSALFDKLPELRKVLTQARRLWPGLLTAKIRLGSRGAGWEDRFAERLRLLEEAGFDAVTLHPRHFEDKFKRRARHELLPWAASLTRLPLIANGDFTGAQQVASLAAHLQPACAIMLGRMAVARPWIFATWDAPMTVDYGDIWRRCYRYVIEDFPPVLALRRVKMFTKYYAANFAFGHSFNVEVAAARGLDEVLERANAFFARDPATVSTITIVGR